MTIRDLVISFGYKIDEKAEKKVNDSIDGLKTFASDALSKTGVGFEVDSKTKAMVFDSVEELKDAAKVLKENDVGFEVDEPSKSLVFNSIEDIETATSVLAENPVGFEVDRNSEQEVMNSIQRIRSMAIRALGVIGIGFSLVTIGRLSEGFGGINDQIRDATRGMGDQYDIQQRILRAANEARQDYGVMANTITRLAQNTEVFASIEDAAGFATLLAQDFAGAAISQEKSAYLTRYLAMDLQQGAVSSRAMNTMLRDAPHMAIRLANSLNVTTYELKEMARAGDITADILKNSFIGSADEINARFAETDMTVSDALRNVRNGWGLFVSEMDSTLGVSRAVAQGIVNGFNQVLFTIRRVIDMFMRVADRMGGVQNLMRLIAIAAGGIFLALKGPAILQFLGAVVKMLRSIGLKKLAIVAVFILLALIVEDFIAFMRGEDSLLGKMLDNLGIDADRVREVIQNVWMYIRTILSAIWGFIREHSALIAGVLLVAAPLILTIVKAVKAAIRVVKVVTSVAKVLGKGLKALFLILKANPIGLIVAVVAALIAIFVHLWRNNEQFRDFFINLWEGIRDFFIGIWQGITSFISSAVEVVGSIIQTLADKFGFVFESIRGYINAVMHVFGGLIDFIVGVFTGDWTKAWEGVRNIFSGIISGLAAIFKLPLNLIITGLNTFIGGLNRISIPDWVPGVGGMGINIPKIPMLATGSDFSPDTFIAGEEGPELITNAKGSKVFTADETADTLGKLNALANWEMPNLFKKAQETDRGGGLGGIIKDMLSIIAPPTQEVADVYNSHTENKYVTQYNEFYNEFHGDRAGQQKSAEAMDEAQEDATGALARALDYVR